MKKNNITDPNNSKPNIKSETNNATTDAQSTEVQAIPNQYIVVLKNQQDGEISQQAAEKAKQITNELLSEHNIPADSVKHRYEYALKGFTAKLPSNALKGLRNSPKVDYIVKDTKGKPYASVTRNSNSSRENSTSSNEIAPWGVTRVQGGYDATGEKAWVIDGGIDLDHGDLNVDKANSASFVASESADDLAGHGTHVAGIIAAKDNSQGAVGVAAGATVVSVKAVDKYGTGSIGEAIDAVDYVTKEASTDEVVNMSLCYRTGTFYTPPLEATVSNAASSGIKFTVAAGNSKINASKCAPANVNSSNVYTVSGYNSNDDFWLEPNLPYGSNFGNPPIDYSAPAADVPSLDIGGGTVKKSGTSMSAPHIAGLLIDQYGERTDGTVSGDLDSSPDNILIADLPISVNASGPNLLNAGQTGYFSANVSYNDGSVSYQWYYRNSPTDSWTADGSGSTYSHTWYQENTDAAVKVEVSSNGETDSDIHHVDITCSSSSITNSSIGTNAPDPCN